LILLTSIRLCFAAKKYLAAVILKKVEAVRGGRHRLHEHQQPVLPSILAKQQAGGMGPWLLMTFNAIYS